MMHIFALTQKSWLLLLKLFPPTDNQVCIVWYFGVCNTGISNGENAFEGLRSPFQNDDGSTNFSSIEDAYHPRNRAMLEIIFNQLENIRQVEHSRHKRQANYFSNILLGLMAYSFNYKNRPGKANLSTHDNCI